MLVFLITISFLLSIVPTSSGLQCYECILCADKGQLITCPSTSNFCQVSLKINYLN